MPDTNTIDLDAILRGIPDSTTTVPSFDLDSVLRQAPESSVFRMRQEQEHAAAIGGLAGAASNVLDKYVEPTVRGLYTFPADALNFPFRLEQKAGLISQEAPPPFEAGRPTVHVPESLYTEPIKVLLESLQYPPQQVQQAQGVAQGVVQFGEGLTSPEMLPLAGVGGVAPGVQRAVGAGFGAQMVSDLPETFGRLGTASVEGTTEEQFKLGTEAALQAGIPFHMAVAPEFHANRAATEAEFYRSAPAVMQDYLTQRQAAQDQAQRIGATIEQLPAELHQQVAAIDQALNALGSITSPESVAYAQQLSAERNRLVNQLIDIGQEPRTQPAGEPLPPQPGLTPTQRVAQDIYNRQRYTAPDELVTPEPESTAPQQPGGQNATIRQQRPAEIHVEPAPEDSQTVVQGVPGIEQKPAGTRLPPEPQQQAPAPADAQAGETIEQRAIKLVGSARPKDIAWTRLNEDPDYKRLHDEGEILLTEQRRIESLPFNSPEREKLGELHRRQKEIWEQQAALPAYKRWWEEHKAAVEQENLGELAVDKTKFPALKAQLDPAAGVKTFEERLAGIPLQYAVHGTDIEDVAGILSNGLKYGSALDFTPNREWASGYGVAIIVPLARKGKKIEHNDFYNSANITAAERVIINAEAYTHKEYVDRKVAELKQQFPDAIIEVYPKEAGAPVEAKPLQETAPAPRLTLKKGAALPLPGVELERMVRREPDVKMAKGEEIEGQLSPEEEAQKAAEVYDYHTGELFPAYVQYDGPNRLGGKVNDFIQIRVVQPGKVATSYKVPLSELPAGSWEKTKDGLVVDQQAIVDHLADMDKRHRASFRPQTVKGVERLRPHVDIKYLLPEDIDYVQQDVFPERQGTSVGTHNRNPIPIEQIGQPEKESPFGAKAKAQIIKFLDHVEQTNPRLAADMEAVKPGGMTDATRQKIRAEAATMPEYHRPEALDGLMAVLDHIMEEPGGLEKLRSLGETPEQTATRRAGIQVANMRDLRSLLNQSEFLTGLSGQVRDILRALIDSPIGKYLDARTLKFQILDEIEGHRNVAAEYSPLRTLITLTRWGSSLSGAHEFFHPLWDMIQSGDKDQVDRWRREAIDAALQTADDQDKIDLQALRDGKMSAQEFQDMGIKLKYYPMSSAEEFFAHMMSDRFAKDRSGVWRNARDIWAKQDGFIAKMRAIIQVIIAALRKQFPQLPQDRLTRFQNDILTGRYEVVPPTRGERGARAAIEEGQREEQQMISKGVRREGRPGEVKLPMVQNFPGNIMDYSGAGGPPGMKPLISFPPQFDPVGQRNFLMDTRGMTEEEANAHMAKYSPPQEEPPFFDIGPQRGPQAALEDRRGKEPMFAMGPDAVVAGRFPRTSKVPGDQMYGRLLKLRQAGQLPPVELEWYEYVGLKDYLKQPRTLDEVATWMKMNPPKVDKVVYGGPQGAIDKPDYVQQYEAHVAGITEITHNLELRGMRSNPVTTPDDNGRVVQIQFATPNGNVTLTNPNHAAMSLNHFISDNAGLIKEYWRHVAGYLEYLPQYRTWEQAEARGRGTSGPQIQQWYSGQAPHAGLPVQRVDVTIPRGIIRQSGGRDEDILWEPDGMHEKVPNTLGWAAIQYETMPSGEKIAHIIELQSRWAQEARDRGVKVLGEDPLEAYRNYLQQKAGDDVIAQAKLRGALHGWDSIDDELKRLQLGIGYNTLKEHGLNVQDSNAFYREYAGRINDHPFLHDWQRLVLKAAIEQALKEGATRIALSDAQTAMLTQGHDASAPRPRRAIDTGRVGDMGGAIVRYEPTGESATESDIRQAPGMRLNYDKLGPKILSELTGDPGKLENFGPHRKAVVEFDQPYLEGLSQDIAEGRSPTGLPRRPQPRPNLIFREPTGEFQTTSKARSYPITQLKDYPFSVLGKDVFQRSATDISPERGPQAALESREEIEKFIKPMAETWAPAHYREMASVLNKGIVPRMTAEAFAALPPNVSEQLTGIFGDRIGTHQEGGRSFQQIMADTSISPEIRSSYAYHAFNEWRLYQAQKQKLNAFLFKTNADLVDSIVKSIEAIPELNEARLLANNMFGQIIDKIQDDRVKVAAGAITNTRIQDGIEYIEKLRDLLTKPDALTNALVGLAKLVPRNTLLQTDPDILAAIGAATGFPGGVFPDVSAHIKDLASYLAKHEQLDGSKSINAGQDIIETALHGLHQIEDARSALLELQMASDGTLKKFSEDYLRDLQEKSPKGFATILKKYVSAQAEATSLTRAAGRVNAKITNLRARSASLADAIQFVQNNDLHPDVRAYGAAVTKYAGAIDIQERSKPGGTIITYKDPLTGDPVEVHDTLDGSTNIENIHKQQQLALHGLEYAAKPDSDPMQAAYWVDFADRITNYMLVGNPNADVLMDSRFDPLKLISDFKIAIIADTTLSKIPGATSLRVSRSLDAAAVAVKIKNEFVKDNLALILADNTRAFMSHPKIETIEQWKREVANPIHNSRQHFGQHELKTGDRIPGYDHVITSEDMRAIRTQYKADQFYIHLHEKGMIPVLKENPARVKVANTELQRMALSRGPGTTTRYLPWTTRKLPREWFNVIGGKEEDPEIRAKRVDAYLSGLDNFQRLVLAHVMEDDRDYVFLKDKKTLPFNNDYRGLRAKAQELLESGEMPEDLDQLSQWLADHHNSNLGDEGKAVTAFEVRQQLIDEVTKYMRMIDRDNPVNINKAHIDVISHENEYTNERQHKIAPGSLYEYGITDEKDAIRKGNSAVEFYVVKFRDDLKVLQQVLLETQRDQAKELGKIYATGDKNLNNEKLNRFQLAEWEVSGNLNRVGRMLNNIKDIIDRRSDFYGDDIANRMFSPWTNALVGSALMSPGTWVFNGASGTLLWWMKIGELSRGGFMLAPLGVVRLHLLTGAKLAVLALDKTLHQLKLTGKESILARRMVRFLRDNPEMVNAPIEHFTGLLREMRYREQLRELGVLDQYKIRDQLGWDSERGFLENIGTAAKTLTRMDINRPRGFNAKAVFSYLGVVPRGFSNVARLVGMRFTDNWINSHSTTFNNLLTDTFRKRAITSFDNRFQYDASFRALYDQYGDNWARFALAIAGRTDKGEMLTPAEITGRLPIGTQRKAAVNIRDTFRGNNESIDMLMLKYWWNKRSENGDKLAPFMTDGQHNALMFALAADVNMGTLANRPQYWMGSKLRQMGGVLGQYWLWNTDRLRSNFAHVKGEKTFLVKYYPQVAAFLIASAIVSLAAVTSRDELNKKLFHTINRNPKFWEAQTDAERIKILYQNAANFWGATGSIINWVNDTARKTGYRNPVFFANFAFDLMNTAKTIYENGGSDWYDPIMSTLERYNPAVRLVMNNLPSREGVMDVRNAANLLWAATPDSLESRRRQSSGSDFKATATTPIINGIANAIALGDANQIDELWKKAVEQKRSEGNPNPEAAVLAAVNARRPESAVYARALSPEEREIVYNRLSPDNRAAVERINSVFDDFNSKYGSPSGGGGSGRSIAGVGGVRQLSGIGSGSIGRLPSVGVRSGFRSLSLSRRRIGLRGIGRRRGLRLRSLARRR